MATLRAVPDTAIRAIGVVRVSKVGDRGDDLVSPELQDTAITDHCTRRGYRLVDRVEAIDDSGSQARSGWWRKLDDTVARIEAGEADVIVVWKFSRFARNRLRWEVALDRVETAGGLLESATEQIDASTSTGRFTRGMLAEIADWEARRIGEGWKEAQARRIRQGLPANGKPRWGYQIVDGMNVPDADLGQVLAGLYRRYVAGESIYTLVGWLNGNGYRTSVGYRRDGPGPWSLQSLRKMLDSGFGAGLLHVHGQHLPGAHQAVIDPDTWTAYQAARDARRKTRSSERSRYLLSGMIRCSCGSKMTGGLFGARANRAGTLYYRCIASHDERRHSGGFVLMRLVEGEVMRRLREVESDLQAAAEATVLQGHRVERARRDASRLGKRISDLTEQLVKLTRQHTADVVPEDVYIAARDEIIAERDQLAAQARHAETEGRTRPAPPREQVRGLLDQWDTLSVEMRRGALRDLLGEIRVVPGRHPQIRVQMAWEG